MNATPAVILLGRGMPKQEQIAVLGEIALQLVADGITARAEVAFLEMTNPGLQDVLMRMAASGETSISVVPAFVPFDRNVRAWLPRAVSQWLRDLPQAPLVRFAAPIEAGSAYRSAVRNAVLATADQPDLVSAVRPMKLRPGSSLVPAHKRHVMVCVGPRCVASGAWETLDKLRTEVADLGMNTGEHRVLVTRSGCLGPCNMAPLALVYPEGSWYAVPNDDVVYAIVHEHLVAGVPAGRFLTRPGETIAADSINAGVADDPVVDKNVGQLRFSGLMARRGMHEIDAAAVFGEISIAYGSDTLLAVSSEHAYDISFHDPRVGPDELPLPIHISPDEPLALIPGELHLMLFGAMISKSEGQDINVRLTFAEAGDVDLILPLHALRGGMGH